METTCMRSTVPWEWAIIWVRFTFSSRETMSTIPKGWVTLNSEGSNVNAWRRLPIKVWVWKRWKWKDLPRKLIPNNSTNSLKRRERPLALFDPSVFGCPAKYKGVDPMSWSFKETEGETVTEWGYISNINSVIILAQYERLSSEEPNTKFKKLRVWDKNGPSPCLCQQMIDEKRVEITMIPREPPPFLSSMRYRRLSSRFSTLANIVIMKLKLSCS